MARHPRHLAMTRMLVKGAGQQCILLLVALLPLAMVQGARIVAPGAKTNWKYLFCRRECCRSVATRASDSDRFDRGFLGGVDGLEVAA